MNIILKHTISVKDYNDIRKSVDWTPLPEIQAQRGIDNTYYLTAAVYNDKVVGMARIISDGGYVAYIADVIVLPSFQGNGIGKMIMNDIINFIKTDLAKDNAVMIALLAAHGKEKFYETFGFITRPNNEIGSGMSQWMHLD